MILGLYYSRIQYTKLAPRGGQSLIIYLISKAFLWAPLQWLCIFFLLQKIFAEPTRNAVRRYSFMIHLPGSSYSLVVFKKWTKKQKHQPVVYTFVFCSELQVKLTVLWFLFQTLIEPNLVTLIKCLNSIKINKLFKRMYE